MSTPARHDTERHKCPLTLTCKVTSNPHPTNNGKPADLRVELSNSGSDYKTDKVTVAIPVGAGTDHLTNDPNSGELEETDVPPGWSVSPEENKTRYVVEPENGTFGTGQRVVFTVKGLKVNREYGTSYVPVIESSEGDPQPCSWAVAKGPQKFFFRGFEPRNIVVRAGMATDLVWSKSNRPPEGCTVSYRLHYDLEPEGVDVTDSQAHKVRPHHDTSYRLVATIDKNGTKTRPVLSTFVIVSHPDVITTNLTVERGVGWFGHRNQNTVDIVPESSAEKVSPPAPTDGLLMVSIDAEVGASSLPTVGVSLLPKTSEEPLHSTTIEAKEDQIDNGFMRAPRLVLPIPNGHRVRFRHDKSVTGVKPYRIRLDWQPIGIGSLAGA
ncbi:hypothetical protein SAMN04487905_12211 [Actinopolyspora xinjiangensis]|uniref:DUF11 domain-containing protein n=1 Tax=Actinopolyspora xinjiangensis TaxID=405564 RepID=A0A1H0X2D5_9ACTN|nr:hypothetical protein [Actinopolyspora xinjiangensis]SDP96875.1 hypothetical protein SAMN04487905_12211 [Actinopolyspora xinjiangensis]